MPGADDHGVARRVTAPTSWTVRTNVATASIGVRCSTPWPRFTMWPRALRPARTSSRADARDLRRAARTARSDPGSPAARRAARRAPRRPPRSDAPVERDDVGAEVRERRRAGAPRRARTRSPAGARGRAARSRARSARPAKRSKRRGREHARPGVEDLHAVRAGRDLAAAASRRRSAPCARAAGRAASRLAPRERREHLEIAREPRLGRVGRERPRRAREADHRGALAELAAQPAHRLAGRRDRRRSTSPTSRARSATPRAGSRRPGPARTRARGPPPRSGSRMSENTTTPSMPKRRNGCSETSAARSGRSHMPRKPRLRAQLAVLGQIAARLAHQPDGRAIDGLAARGAHEARARLERGATAAVARSRRGRG